MNSLRSPLSLAASAVPIQIDDYVDIKSAKSEKNPPSVSLPLPISLKTGSSGRRLGSIAPVSATIYLSTTNTSAAGTAQAVVTSLIPGACAEYAFFAALFDEVIVDSLDIMTSFYMVSTAAVQNVTLALQTFDPLDFNAPTSILALLPQQQRMKHPLVMTTSAAAVAVGNVVTVNGDGWCKWSVNIPRGGARAAALATLFGHEWSPTAEVTDLYGVLKTYVEAPSALAFTVFRSFIGFNCRFRCRS